MDLRSLINTINLLEGITMAEIQTAVGQETDEQKRAAILNDLAWKHNLPGLYDPVSGYFVRKQGMPTAGEGSYSISSTAREADTQALAKMGLVPRNAKTSDLGGLVGTGSLFGSKEDNAKAAQAVIGQSSKADSSSRDARGNAFVKKRLMQLKNLVARIRGQQSPSSAFQQPPSAVGQSGQKAGSFVPTPSKGWDSQVRESINYGLTNILNEDFGVEMEADATSAPAAAPAPSAKFEKEIVLIRRIMADLEGNEDPAVIAALMDAQKALDEIENPAAPAGNDKEKDRARMKELVDITKKAPVATSDMEEGITVKAIPLTDAEKYAAIRDRLLQIESAVQEAETPAERRARRNGQPTPAAPTPSPAPSTSKPADSPQSAASGSSAKVPPMPDPNFKTGTMAQRDEWIAKYGKSHNMDGTPKPGVTPTAPAPAATGTGSGPGSAEFAKTDPRRTDLPKVDKPTPSVASKPPVSQSGQSPAPAAGDDYVIKKGDTLGKIAAANGTTVDALMKLNPQITNPNLIYAGKTLKLGGSSKPATGGSKTNLTKYYADEMAEMEKLIAKYASDPEMAGDVKAAQTQLDSLKATAK